MKTNEKKLNRRKFIGNVSVSILAMILPVSVWGSSKTEGIIKWIYGDSYDPHEHYWGLGIDIAKCIGCGRCVDACKTENNVPRKPFFFRTWVERYQIMENGETNTKVDSPNGAIDGFKNLNADPKITRSFFVPKICNHCDNPPCTQVCPVGATYKSVDGVILVDNEYCIGCRYCIQACPYGARYLNPTSKVADKCTFCYHRITKEKLPACVEVCPTQARVFGELKKKASPLVRFKRMNKISVLKQELNTKPKVFYTNFDMEVK